jgi:hypothetical protein
MTNFTFFASRRPVPGESEDEGGAPAPQ